MDENDYKKCFKVYREFTMTHFYQRQWRLTCVIGVGVCVPDVISFPYVK